MSEQHTPGRLLHDMWVRAALCTSSVYYWDDLSEEMRGRWDGLAGQITANRRAALQALPDISIDEINALPSKQGQWISSSSNDFVVRLVRDAYRAGIAKAAGTASPAPRESK